MSTEHELQTPVGLTIGQVTSDGWRHLWLTSTFARTDDSKNANNLSRAAYYYVLSGELVADKVAR